MKVKSLILLLSIAMCHLELLRIFIPEIGYPPTSTMRFFDIYHSQRGVKFFNIIINHTFPENSVEIPQVVPKI